MNKITILVQVNLCQKLFFCRTRGEHVVYKNCSECQNNFCPQHDLPRFKLGIFMYWTFNSMNNLSSYCGLVDAKKRASDKVLPVLIPLQLTLCCTDEGPKSVFFPQLLLRTIHKIYYCIGHIFWYHYNVLDVFGSRPYTVS